MRSSLQLIQLMSMVWLMNGGESVEQLQGAITNSEPVFVEINPGVFQSRNILKMDSTEKRLKRDNIDVDKPSLVLEFTSGFFANPKLKNLYKAITGAREEHDTQMNGPPILAKNVEEHSTDALNMKRELTNKGEEAHNFYLKIKPNVPKRVNPIREYNGTCKDKPVDEQWCGDADVYVKCPMFEPTVTTTTTCHPTKPCVTKKLHFCGANWKDHRPSANPCSDQNVTRPATTTEYTACSSSPPPDQSPTWGPVTPLTCTDAIIPTVTSTEPITTTTSVVQKCDSAPGAAAVRGLVEKNKVIEPDRYFILFKRSPTDSWKQIFRRKREQRPQRMFKFKLVPNV